MIGWLAGWLAAIGHVTEREGVVLLVLRVLRGDGSILLLALHLRS